MQGSRNSRRNGSRILCVLFSAWLFGCNDASRVEEPSEQAVEAPAARPNIILMLVDTLRADHLGSYGFDGPISPNLDRFAAEAVLFEQCFSPAPWTKPAVATLFTGLDPLVHQVLTHRGHLGNPKDYRVRTTLETDTLRPSLRTLAEELRDAGYATGAVVVNPWLGREQGFDQGFDYYEDRLRGNEVDATAVLLKAERWLAERPKDRPFFLYLHFMDVHSPYDAAEADVDAIRGSPSLGPERTLQTTELARGMFDYPKHPKADWARTPAFFELREWRARYAGGVHALDRKIGGLLDRLRADGTLDRSVVVLTADHGEELFDHQDWGHGKNLYDHQLRIPLLVRNPGAIGAGRRVDALVALSDIMPTLVGMGGGKLPAGPIGRDLRPFLGSEPAALRLHDMVFATGVKWKPAEHSVRTLQHKLIVDVATGPARVFDVANDAAEKQDVATTQPQLSAELRRHLDEHLAAVIRQPRQSLESTELPAEVVERLRALGYLDAEKQP